MSFKEKPLKLFVLVFTIVLLVGITGSVFLKSYKERGSESFEKGFVSFPQIVNSPSRSLILGSEFVFVPKVVPSDGDISVTLLEAPEWLVLQDMVIRGIPNEQGVFDFMIRLEKEGRYVDYEYSLIVSENFDE